MATSTTTRSRSNVTRRYNCLKCPGFCCSYPVIPINKTDIKRLGKHFGLGFEAAEKKFTKQRGKERILRRHADPVYGKICRFFDTEERRCTVYEARPGVCRQYPASNRCGYYDFLSFERKHQGDKDFVARTDYD
ncbi:MAG: YkgJ family cysteine cluster protein [Beijerinckiaceae bacterium]